MIMDTVPFLANLGVLDTDQVRDPTAQAFPMAFNPNCRRVWDAVLTDLVMTDDVGFNWGSAIRAFLEQCISQDLYPFSNLKQSANDQILTALGDARKAVVKFLNRSKMLHYVNLRATLREVQMSNVGFTLRVLGNATLKDPTFEKWLLQMPMPAFRQKHNGRWIKHLSSEVTMVVFNEGTQRWRVGYEIVCHHFPDLPGKHLPSKAELEKFVLDILWTPILKSHRPDGFHHRLI